MWKIYIGLLELGIVTVVQVFAQTDPNSHRKSTDHEETPNLKPAELPAFLFPDFFHYDAIKNEDTSWSYDCFDRDMHRINMHYLKSVDEIDHMEYSKSYKSPAQPSNSLSPYTSYIYELVYKYVHPDTNIWLRVDPKIHEIKRYEIYKDKIVRTDTMKLIDPATKKPRNVICKYFKTEIITTDK